MGKIGQPSMWVNSVSYPIASYIHASYKEVQL